MTAGGNDLRFVGSMLYEAWSQADPAGPIATMMVADFPHGIPEPTPAAIDAMARGLAQIVGEARARTSDARVVLVDYLTVFTEATARDADWPFSPSRRHPSDGSRTASPRATRSQAHSPGWRCWPPRS